MNESLLLLGPILLVLVALSGFFSGAEVAIVSIDLLEAKRFVNEKRENAKVLLRLKTRQRATLVALLIGNNIVNILASSLAAALAITFFGDLGIGIATFVMTVLILIVGEIIPKTYCSRHASKIALSIAPLVLLIKTMLGPLVSFLIFSQDLS